MAYKLLPEKSSPKPSKGELTEDVVRAGLVQPAKSILASLPGSFGDLAKGANDLVAAPIGKLLPTTKQHIKNLEKAIPYLKPKNKVEKFSEEIAEDAAGLFLPGRYLKMGKYAFSPLRSIGIAVGANTLGEGVTQWTGDKSKGDIVKNGSMLAFSLLNPRGAKDVSRTLYADAERILPQNATVSTTRLNNDLLNTTRRITNGRQYDQLSANERFVIDEIGKIHQSSQNGTISVSTLQSMKRSLNDTLKSHLYDIKDRSVREGVRSMATSINGSIRNTLRDYGRQNPQWWETYSAADRAHGAVEQSNFVSRTLEKFMRGRPEGLAHLFGIGAPAALSWLSIPAGLGTGAAYAAAKLGTRVIRSRELAKHYGKVVGAASADNPKLIHKELDEFQKELEKEKKPKYRLRPNK
jgi:hypothetical protein